MVSGQDNQCVLIEFLLSEESQHAAHLRISKSNLAIVGLCFVLLVVGSRRPVGVMRIIQMDPEEKTLGVVVAQPGQGLVDHHITRALHGVEVCLIKPAEVKMVIVEVKSAVEPKARIEDSRADYAGRGVTLTAEEGGQRRLAGGKAVTAEVVYSGPHGVAPRENRSMSRQRDRHRSIGLLETHSFKSQAVNVRRANLTISVATEVICTQ